uniref:Uncharacterized protein n=1 Tax=Magallana gigas TaxID=29159 RepID=K1R6E7_MAGGI
MSVSPARYTELLDFFINFAFIFRSLRQGQGELMLYPRRWCRHRRPELVKTFPFFPDYDKEHTVGVTGQQRMITPPTHLILPLRFSRVKLRKPLSSFSVK